MSTIYEETVERGLKRAELWGIRDCSNDASENVPFASVGGLGCRGAFLCPEYVPYMYREAYATGYAGEAERIYGADWKTAPFEWSRSLEVTAAVEEAAEPARSVSSLDAASLDAASARVLTTREMAKILSSLVTGLCEWNAVVDVRATVRWLHENEEFWRVQCMSREALEAYVLAAVARPAPAAAEEPTA